MTKMKKADKTSCAYSETQNCPYSYAEETCPLLDIWEDFRAEDEVVAVSHHATCDTDELPVVRGEFLTFVAQHGDKYCKVKNSGGRIGFLPLSHITLKEEFQDEPWYLEVCTRKMAESIVNPKKVGAYIVWRSDERSKNMIITVKQETCVEHFEFKKKGSRVLFEDRIYKSLYQAIHEFRTEGILEYAIKVKFPFRKTNNNHIVIAENLILAGPNLRACKEFKCNKKLSHITRLRDGHINTLIGTLPDQSWYVVRDVVTGLEGFVPAEHVQPLFPPWFHGQLSENEIKELLCDSQRTCSFVVVRNADDLSTHTPYILAVLDPLRNIQILDITYKDERVGCFNSAHYSITQLINTFLTEQTVPMLKYAVTNQNHYSALMDLTDLDIKSMDLYFMALEEGSEKDYNLRIMIVGHHGVGKTTVARKLMQETTENICSTEGIETQVKKARIDTQTGDWIYESIKQEQDDLLDERLVQVVRENSKDDSQNQSYVLKQNDGYSTIDEIENTEETTLKQAVGNHAMDKDNKKKGGCFYDTAEEVAKRRNRDVENTFLKNRRRIPSDSERYSKPKTGSIKLRNSYTELTPEKRKKIANIVKRSSKGGFFPGYISIWDFAGQYIYYATHQVFLATNAIYFLVLDMSRSLDDNVPVTDYPGNPTKEINRSTRAFIELWLQSIHAKKDGEIGNLPPVILVGTHKDKLPCSPENREEYVNNYFESIRSLFDLSPLINHIQPEQICLDNTIEESDMTELKDIIFAVAKRMPWWGKLKPAKWIHLEQVIMSLEKDSPVASVKEIIDANQESALPVEDEDEIRAFLRTQHSSGDLLFFEEAGLEETVVLRPQWIIDAFKSLTVTFEQLRRYSHLRPYLSELYTKGILHKVFIDRLWEQADLKMFAERKDLILLYMIRLCIIAKAKGSNSNENKHDEVFFFVPSLLPDLDNENNVVLQRAISEERVSQDTRPETPALYIKVEESSYYPSLFHNVMAECLSRWEPVKQNDSYKIYSTGGLFTLDKSRAHLMSLRIRFLAKDAYYIVCKLDNIVQEKVDSRKCDEVRRFLASAVASHINLPDPSSLELLIQCTHPNVENVLGSLSSCEMLDRYQSVGCHGHSGSFYNTTINSAQLLSFWYPNGYRKDDYSSLKQWVEKAPEYVNDRTLSDKDFEKLALALGVGWEHVGISLGISSTEMDHCKLDYPQRTDMQVYAVLKKWKRNNQTKVTFLMFVKALFENERAHVDWDTVKNVGEGVYS